MMAYWRELIGLKYLLSRIPPTLGLPAKARGGPRNAAQNSGESAQPPRVPPGGSWRRARVIDSSVGFRGTIRPGGQDAEKCSCLFIPHFADVHLMSFRMKCLRAVLSYQVTAKSPEKVNKNRESVRLPCGAWTLTAGGYRGGW